MNNLLNKSRMTIVAEVQNHVEGTVKIGILTNSLNKSVAGINRKCYGKTSQSSHHLLEHIEGTFKTAISTNSLNVLRVACLYRMEEKNQKHIEGTFKIGMEHNSLNTFPKLFERSDILDSNSSMVRLAYLTLMNNQ